MTDDEELYAALRKLRDIGTEIDSWQYSHLACSKVLMRIDHILRGQLP